MALNPMARLPMFAGVDEDALELLAARARPHVVQQGDVVVRQGESGNRMFMIISGSVRVVRADSEGQEVELARLREGDFFGEMCILDTLPRSATVVALEEGVLLTVDSMAFLALYEAMPKQYGLVVLNIARDLSRRLRRLDSAFGS